MLKNRYYVHAAFIMCLTLCLKPNFIRAAESPEPAAPQSGKQLEEESKKYAEDSSTARAFPLSQISRPFYGYYSSRQGFFVSNDHTKTPVRHYDIVMRIGNRLQMGHFELARKGYLQHSLWRPSGPDGVKALKAVVDHLNKAYGKSLKGCNLFTSWGYDDGSEQQEDSAEYDISMLSFFTILLSAQIQPLHNSVENRNILKKSTTLMGPGVTLQNILEGMHSFYWLFKGNPDITTLRQKFYGNKKNEVTISMDKVAEFLKLYEKVKIPDSLAPGYSLVFISPELSKEEIARDRASVQKLLFAL